MRSHLVHAWLAIVLNRAHRIWKHAPTPRWLTAMQCAIYVTAAVGGLVTLLDPPATVSRVMGPTLSTAWGWGLMVGGLIGAGVVFCGIWWVEKIGLLLVMTAAAMYLGVAVELHIGNPPEGSRATQMTVTLIAMWGLAIRLAWIWGPAVNPDKYINQVVPRD